MEKPSGRPTLDERTGVTIEERQAEISSLADKVSRTGIFELDHDGSDLRQTRWMIECELIVEAICRLPDIQSLVKTDRLDRNELLHEALCHFIDAGTDVWNLSWRVEQHLQGFEPFDPAAAEEPEPVFEGLVWAMARFRAASDASQVLGSWLEVWSWVAKLIAELLSEMARRRAD